MLCPLCSQADLDPFFDGGSVPLFVNVLYGTSAEAKQAPRGEIRLGGCPKCGLIHNVLHDPKLVEYAPGYENSLHGSPVFQDWATSLAQGLVERHSLAGARAVEIGGGRGEFMQLLVDAGAQEGLVMDPSAPDDSIVATDQLRIERRLFDASDASGGDHPTRLLLTRHVLEHIAAPLEFVKMLTGAAQSTGAGLYVEVPNGLWTIRDLGVWDVIYEHCSYFTPGALRAAFMGAGAKAVTVHETYGDQFLSAEFTSEQTQGPEAAADLTREAELRAAFGEAQRDMVSGWNATLGAWRKAGKRAAIWGAGSKGATFLNTIEGDGVIVCAVDVNERKLGRFIAGTGHEILSPAQLSNQELDSIIVMNPRYQAEIETMARQAGSDAEVLSIVQ